MERERQRKKRRNRGEGGAGGRRKEKEEGRGGEKRRERGMNGRTEGTEVDREEMVMRPERKMVLEGQGRCK